MLYNNTDFLDTWYKKCSCYNYTYSALIHSAAYVRSVNGSGVESSKWAKTNIAASSSYLTSHKGSCSYGNLQSPEFFKLQFRLFIIASIGRGPCPYICI